MHELAKIDFTKLLGFETVADHLVSGTVDLQDPIVGAKLGAKVGGKPENGYSEPGTKG